VKVSDVVVSLKILRCGSPKNITRFLRNLEVYHCVYITSTGPHTELFQASSVHHTLFFKDPF